MGFISDAVTGLSDSLGLKEPLDDLADSVGDFARANPALTAALVAGAAIYAPQIAQYLMSNPQAVTYANTGEVFVNGAQVLSAQEAAAMTAQGLAAQGITGEAAASALVDAGFAGDVALAGVSDAMTGLAPSMAGSSGSTSLWGKLGSALADKGSAASKLTNMAGGLMSAGLAGEYTDEQINRTRAIAADAAKAAEFKLYTISTPTSGVNYTKDGMTMGLSPQSQYAQDKAASLFGNQQVGSYDQFRGASDNALQAMNNYSMMDTSGMMGVGANALDASNYFMGASMMQDPALNTQRGQTQALANQLYSRASQDPYTASQELFNQMANIRSPQNERDRIDLEQRMAAQGRLGIATAAYGGTSEQLAMAKAQQEQMSRDALQATTTSRDWLNQDIGAYGQMSQQDASLAQAIQQLQSGNANIANAYGSMGQGMFGQASNIRGQDINNISNLGNLGSNMANIASNLSTADANRLQQYLNMYYQPTTQARQDAAQMLAAQKAVQDAAWAQGALKMQGENAVAARLAKQQDQYSQMASGMLGGGNAAQTLTNTINAGKAVYDLGSSAVDWAKKYI